MTVIDQWTDGYAQYRKVRTTRLGQVFVQIKYPGEFIWKHLPFS